MTEALATVGIGTLVEMYRRMLRIRRFDETAGKLAERGEVPGSVHASIGQEGAIVGACMALRTDDYMTGYHRSHGHPIGKGSDVRGLMAELLGKSSGVCHGKGGSMHLADFRVGSLGESGVIGSSIPIAAGAAFTCKYRRLDRVVLAFFGDGAANSGGFHETLNLAAVWKLPVVFFCENNQYASTTNYRSVTAVADIAQRASAYDMPGLVLDGQDAVSTYERTLAAVARARRGEGPSLLEAKTYRFRGHSEALRHALGYRPKEEEERWLARDPVVIHRRRLLEAGVPAGDVERLEGEVAEEIKAALASARESPYPRPDELFTDLFAEASEA